MEFSTRPDGPSSARALPLARRRHFLALVLCVLAVLIAVLWARPASAADALPANFMTTDQIKPGMIGEGRTVFQGFKVEPFKVEILGVEHNAMAGGDMILARISGQLLENHGVVAGMSGSPIYIDGKLIGALAYGWSFAYKPYCGITPIAEMWSVWQSIGVPALADPGPGGANNTGGDEVWDWHAAWQAYQAREEGRGGASEQSLGFKPTLPELKNEPGEMRALSAPLFLSGAPPQVESRVRNFFAARGVEVLSAGAMAGSAADGDSNEVAPPFEGGSGVGIPLLSGDLALSAIGTVTYAQGDKLIAFGHPMFNEGGSSAPMATAYIFGFLQSYERSSKFGEVRDVRGTIEQDRQFAIGGRLGPIPPRVPITVDISGPGASRPRTYHFSVWKNHEYVPSLTLDAYLEAYTASVSEAGKGTASTQYTLTLGDGRKVSKRFYESSDGLPIASAAVSAESDLFMLYENPFHEADLKSIEISTRVEPGLHEEALVSAETDHADYLAGETVHITARLRRYRDADYSKSFELALPADLKPGPYVIHLADSAGQSRIAQTQAPGRYDPRTFEQVVSMVQMPTYLENELGLYLFEPQLGIDVRGQSLTGIPYSMQTLIQSTAPSQAIHTDAGRQISARTIPMPAPVQGSQSLIIQVVDHLDQ